MGENVTPHAPKASVRFPKKVFMLGLVLVLILGAIFGWRAWSRYKVRPRTVKTGTATFDDATNERIIREQVDSGKVIRPNATPADPNDDGNVQ